MTEGKFLGSLSQVLSGDQPLFTGFIPAITFDSFYLKSVKIEDFD